MRAVPDRIAALRAWLAASLLAAAAASAFDAALLQRSRSYFTGGFLSSDHIRTPGQAVAFLGGSVLADVAVMSLVALGALRLVAWLRLPARASIVATAVLAFVPIVLADVVSYRLHAFLGDAFDLDLMFDLTGRNVGEVWAVASDHLLAMAGGLGAGLGLVGLLALVARRRGSMPTMTQPPLRSALVVVSVAFVVATVSTVLLRGSSEVLDNGLRRKPSGQWLGSVANLLSDVDRDGAGVLGRPPDPALLDGRIRPYAPDLPGNGVDEDGVGGDLPADAQPYSESTAPAPQWARKPDVVLVVLESFRADAFGARVDGTPVTPTLDALARAGVTAPRAYSHNGYTVQARYHILTGSLAGLREPTTLIDDFSANGYETAYFSAQDESFGADQNSTAFMRADVAYDARADRARRYTAFTTAGSLAVPFPVLVERVSTFLRTRRQDKPLFLYVNFHDTHFPYAHAAIESIVPAPRMAAGDIVPKNAAALRAMYLNTAANVDRAIGKVLAEVRDTRGADPGVVVLSDHGESLFDEGFLGHGYTLNDAQTRIPLIVSNLPLTVAEPFGQSDLRDMLRTGLAAPAEVPTVVPDRDRRVFRYLGQMHRPAAIAFTGLTSELVYDFRERTVQIDGGPWRSPDGLSRDDRERWIELVRMWERMALARARASR